MRSVLLVLLLSMLAFISACATAKGKNPPSPNETVGRKSALVDDPIAPQDKVVEKGKNKAMSSASNKEIATLAGGCFWCLEAVYNDLKGVEKVVSGYSGGQVKNPSYEQVSSGTTGHAEVIQLTFDPTVISFKELLEVFFTIHDPTTLNQQGADHGTQYRSAIFYHSPEQKAVAEKVIADITAQKIWDNRIVTEVTALSNYYPAENYHQLYFERNPNAGYCRVVIAPKVYKFRKQFISKLKKQPAEH